MKEVHSNFGLVKKFILGDKNAEKIKQQVLELYSTGGSKNDNVRDIIDLILNSELFEEAGNILSEYIRESDIYENGGGLEEKLDERIKSHMRNIDGTQLAALEREFGKKYSKIVYNKSEKTNYCEIDFEKLAEDIKKRMLIVKSKYPQVEHFGDFFTKIKNIENGVLEGKHVIGFYGKYLPLAFRNDTTCCCADLPKGQNRGA
jgi:hypothetical protein